MEGEPCFEVLKQLLIISLKPKSKRSKDLVDVMSAIFIIASEYNQKSEDDGVKEKMISSFFFRFILAREIFKYIANDFLLGLYSSFELDYLFFLLKNSMDSILANLQQGNLTRNQNPDIIREDFNSNFIADEIAMVSILKILYSFGFLFTSIIKEGGQMKFKDSRIKEKARIKNRFSNLDFLKYVAKIDYDSFDSVRKNIKNEYGKERDKKLLACENLLIRADQMIKNFKQIDSSLRTCYYSDEILNLLMKSIICNKLSLSKFKKINESSKGILTYEFKYGDLFPVIQFEEK